MNIIVSNDMKLFLSAIEVLRRKLNFTFCSYNVIVMFIFTLPLKIQISYHVTSLD